MVAKGKGRAGIRQRKPISRSSDTQEWGLEKPADFKFLTVRNSIRRGRVCVRSFMPANRAKCTKQCAANEDSGEANNLRLCSLMFAYVRLVGEKCLRTCADSFLWA